MRNLLATLLLLAACRGAVPATAPPGGGSGPPVEICTGGKDEDGNGLTDCADPACRQDPACPVCGDGYLDDREACEGDRLRGATCETLGFDGGVIGCSACQIDTSGCTRRENCGTPGDEDHNGVADCADPACTADPGCWVLSLESSGGAQVSSEIKVVLKLSDGAGLPVANASIEVAGPPFVDAGQAAVTGIDGRASFEMFLGREPGKVGFTARVEGEPTSLHFSLQVEEAAPQTILTVLNARQEQGVASSGPAITAAVQPILDVAVASTGDVYAAEACRILRISAEGVLSVVAGDGTCSGAADDASADSGISVLALALDDASHVLFFADDKGSRVRALDLAGGTMRTVAKGLAPTALALADGYLHVWDGAGNRLARIATDGTSLSTEISAGADCTGISGCDKGGCHPAADPGGVLYLSGELCPASDPGIARLDTRGLVPLTGAKLPAPDLAAGLLFNAAPIMAFDAGGNLFVAEDDSVMRVDGATTAISTELQDSPSGMVFGPGGDLYLGESGRNSVRRVVGVGALEPTQLTVTVLTGDGQTVDLGQNFGKRLEFSITDASGAPVRSAALMVGSDPGVTIGFQTQGTGYDGKAIRYARAGIVPGMETLDAFAPGLDGRPHGLAEFSALARTPEPGTLVTVIGAPGASNPLPLPGETLPAPSSAISARSILAASDGSLYAAEMTRIVRLAPDGGLTWVAGQATACFDPSDGPLAKACINPGAMALDEKHRLLYLIDNFFRVRRIDLTAATIELVAGGTASEPAPGLDATSVRFGNLQGIALDGAGKLYLADVYKGLFRVDLGTGKLDSFLADLPCEGGPLTGAISVTVGGGVVYLSSNRCGPSVASVLPDGTLDQLVSAMATNLTIDPAGRVAYVTDTDVMTWDPVTATVDSFAHLSPLGLAFNAAGRAAVIQPDGTVAEIW